MRITSAALLLILALILVVNEPQSVAQETGQPTLAQPEKAQPEKAQPEKAQPEKAQPEKAQPEKAQPEKAQPEKKPDAVNDEAKGAAPASNNKPEAIDVDELLRQLETVIRDPFSPDRAIVREQRKANNEFVELSSAAALPTLQLVCYAERPVKGAEKTEGAETVERLVGLKIEGRVYFVRKDDRVTLPRTAGNLVIEISSIENGFVEVKVGTLQESIIVR